MLCGAVERTYVRVQRQLLVFGLLGLAAAGCGDDAAVEDPSTTAGNGAGTSGGSGQTARAGEGGSSGAAASGGTTGGAGMSAGRGGAGRSGSSAAGSGGGDMMSEDDAGVPMTDASIPMDAAMGMDDDAGAGECVPPPNPLNLAGFPKCSEDVCPAQDSVCLPSSFLTQLNISPESIEMLADCDDANKCVPEALARQAGRALLTKCESVIGAEGRCLSTCVPQVALQSQQLPLANCAANELCAPCYDPRTGEETGACSQGCDTGPTEPPKTFDSCCGDRGLCVPPGLAADQAPNLNQDTCDTGLLCAPSELADPTYRPQTCASLDGAEGRCLSTCIGGAVAQQRDRLPTAGCGTDEVCAPCFDPVTGEDTGACRINGDNPAREPYTFARCCGDDEDSAGVCVSPELAADQASILRQESCSRGKLCAPVEKANDPDYRFPICYGTLGAGACVSSCILSPLQAAILSRETCEQGELCAPCTLLGSPTGACD